MVRNKYVLFAFSLAAGGMFSWAGVLKITDPLGFAQMVMNYRVVSREIAFFIALILPWMEVLSGAFLILGIFRRSSALLILLMLIGFIGLVSLTMLRGIDTECGCFGSLNRKADLWLIITDTIMLFFVLSIFFSRSKPK